MKNIFCRLGAFILDLILVTAIIQGIVTMNFFFPKADELKETYQKYYFQERTYQALNEASNKWFEDNKLDKDELEDLNLFYGEYKKSFQDIKVDEEIKEDKIEEVKENIQNQFMDIANPLMIRVNKLNTPQIIVSIIVYILYFGVLQYALNGQTPFKRLLRVKVINKDDKKKKISLLSYIIRAILVTEIILLVGDLILNYTLNGNAYMVGNYWLQQIKYVYELAFIVCLIIRDDARSIDDLLLKTRVIHYDKSGKEIINPLFQSEENEKLVNKSN